ncbi:MAG: hypothetical protein A2Y15_03620 [Clostridiales bacterium GWF2_36_10]|nr:MAG: hypothetical protein A2Y15_03620 [Clostridiales bacterium GWF2_36_10]HAN20286.1 undecaprenyl-diphosphate phosphatase [Clostridiales bacterium]
MSVTMAIILGVIQGIAEFLPISSSGHLALMHNFFGVSDKNNLAFDILLHLATLFAVCIVYRKDVWLIVKGFFTLIKKLFSGEIKKGLDYGEKLFVMLVIASIPLIPIVLIKDKVEYLSEISWVIGILLIINGIMLYISDKLSKNEETLQRSDLQKPFFIGLFQVFGVLPGISRSGSTITGGLFFGLNRQDAVKFSFLMSIPAIIGACVFELPEFFSTKISEEMVLPLIAGVITAAVVGFISIKILQYIAKYSSFGIFSIYCFFIGITAIVADILK